MTKSPRIWRYEVTRVWGSMEGRLEVGAVVLDKWKGRGEQPWNLYDTKDMAKGPVGGWSARLLGEADEDATRKVHEGWERKRAEVVA